ncbi:SE1561 family protein [Bacillus sp. FJAT-29814]|uniref:SE1561 family protein n=1 Tax=Bacillus sp. FJAT-29814 TaxID=1729688 RepID=UPI00082DD6EE|nr:SE1561 family protein [Bacillus sp. FJAT-29814]
MGSQIHDKNVQVNFLKQRLNMFIDVLDAIDPEETDLEDIDRLISILDEMESKCREFNNRDLSEPVK